MGQVRAVVFDIDGTLLDTSEYIYRAFEHVLEKHGHTPRSRQEIASQIGKKIEECYAFLAGDVDHEVLISSHDDFQTANLALIEAFSNVSDVLSSLKAGEIKVGLWTGRDHLVEKSLASGGLDPGEFDCIVLPSMAKNGKPHPGGLLVTLKKLGVEPREAIMVGDSSLDIVAGKKGGVLATVGITHGFGTRAELIEAEADYIIDSIDKILDIVDNLNK